MVVTGNVLCCGITAETSFVELGSVIGTSSGGLRGIVAVGGFVIDCSSGGFDRVVCSGGVLSCPGTTWESVLDACESLLPP